MKRIAVWLGLSVLSLVAIEPSIATQVSYVSPRQMGQESELVVLGTVSDVRSFWNESRTKILTETLVSIDETYKGQNGPTARVIQLGGVVGNVRMHVYGAPGWNRGEEVLLFLDSAGGGAYRVAGFSQGKFMVERDPRTGRAFITHPAMDDVEWVGTPSGESQPPARTERTPLDQFIDKALERR
jgi:hypothetical protein